MTTKKKSVGVIGLGPGGLAVVKELKHDGGFDVTGFDRCSRVGGRWSLDNNHNAGIWKELCTNTTRRHMEFSDFPWDAEDNYDGKEQAYAGIYPHCTEARAYLEGYAKNFDLYPNLRLETEVKSIEQVAAGWKIITTTSSKEDGSDNTTSSTTHEFDAIVVCSGPQAKAYHPLESKFKKDFTGEVIHSQDFLSEKDYKDKRVLVIGGSVSGSEIVSLLAEEDSGCQKAIHSVRRMPYHVEKFTKDTHTAWEDHLFIRSVVWLGRIMPDSVVAKGLKMTVLQHWPEQCTSSSADSNAMPNCSVGVDPDVTKCGITVTKNYVDQVQKGTLQVKPEVASVDGKTITFVDETTEEFDVIICATGYDFDISFLPESVQEQIHVPHPNTGKKIMSLYKNTLVPVPELVDTLAFCGLMNSIGPIFPQGEMQARYIAAIWSGKIPRPSLSTLQLNADAATKKRLDTSSILNQYDTATVVNEDIGDELGVTPSYATAFSAPKKYLLGPVYSCFYRTNAEAPGGDEAVAKRCRERFDKLIASSPQVEEL